MVTKDNEEENLVGELYIRVVVLCWPRGVVLCSFYTLLNVSFCSVGFSVSHMTYISSITFCLNFLFSDVYLANLVSVWVLKCVVLIILLIFRIYTLYCVVSHPFYH